MSWTTFGAKRIQKQQAIETNRSSGQGLHSASLRYSPAPQLHVRVRLDVALFSLFNRLEVIYSLDTWYVPTSPYAGVLAMRCVAGAEPRRQCTELGLNSDRMTPRRILLR